MRPTERDKGVDGDYLDVCPSSRPQKREIWIENLAASGPVDLSPEVPCPIEIYEKERGLRLIQFGDLIGFLSVFSLPEDPFFWGSRLTFVIEENGTSS